MKEQAIGPSFGLIKELSRLKTQKEKIMELSDKFRQSENPLEIMGSIREYLRENPHIDRFLKITKTLDTFGRAEEWAEERGWYSASLEALKEFGINYKVIGEENIPEEGSVLYVSNHPYGVLDGALLMGALGSSLEEKGRKLRLLVSNNLKIIEGIEEVVDFISSSDKTSLRKPLRYLRDGGDLAIFPAGSVSKPRLREFEWKNGFKVMTSYCNQVVPTWISGPDHGRIYNLLSRSNKTSGLRHVLIARESWNKKGETLTLNIGSPLETEFLRELGDNGEIGEYIRRASESLRLPA
jgi:1-acyl-sn-glycerol-3-phosphate acyltransferase